MAPLIAALLVVAAPQLARVKATSVWPLAGDGGSDWVGVIKRGAIVGVEGCEDGGRASLEHGRATAGCGGFEPVDAPEATSNEPALRWGSVRDGGAAVRARARPDAGIVEVLEPPYTLALIDDSALRERGWAKRPTGGFVRLTEVWLDRPSPFTGEERPRLPLAFVFRDAAMALPLPAFGPASPVPKHARFEVQALEGSSVVTSSGLLPRAAVRLAWRRRRPAAVPEGARWVHVDLREQALVAYEGDEPVYATLISAGTGDTPEHRTRTGLHKVWLKSLHDRMHGEGYLVEEVPLIMFFKGGQGLHGAFWHDAFGRPASHGCVNVSMADARWLFAWAPPRLPPGWHTVKPAPLEAETLWVQIERAAAAPPPELVAQEPAP